MFGECHGHIIMDGLNYHHAVSLHQEAVQDSVIRQHFLAYQKRGVTFFRDGGDALGVSKRARELAPAYGIDYRTPVFAIHKKGYYGGIVGHGFTDMAEYRDLVAKADGEGCDFIKIMTTGIMDFDCAGVLSCPDLPHSLVKEMIHIAHEEGLAVMAHTNGKLAVEAASHYGVDSIEHGNFIDEETIQVLKENNTVFVPTISTIANLRGRGRFPEKEISNILDLAQHALSLAWVHQVITALGSDAGAFLVPHGQGIADEYLIFQEILGASSQLDQWLQRGEDSIKERFSRKR